MITIRRWTAAALVLLSLGAALTTPSLAHAAVSSADLTALAGDDFDAKSQAIDHLASDDSPQAAALLKALADDTVVTVGDRLAIQDGEKTLDPITGAPIKGDNAGSITLNNVLRAKVATAAAAGALRSPDHDARAQAIDTMLQNPSPAFKTLIEQARQKETDPTLRKRLDQLWAQTALHDTDAKKRREAIDLIAAAGDPQMRDLLLPIVAKQADGTYAEPDASVRSAADIALTKLAAAQRRSEFFGTLFAGLSLGSVLLLAALGLAITYGLPGRRRTRRLPCGGLPRLRAGAHRHQASVRPPARNAAHDVRYQPAHDPGRAHAVRRAERGSDQSLVDERRRRRTAQPDVAV